MKVLLIANGQCNVALPDPAYFDCVIAVDGGGNYADLAGIIPHIVIGDGDSLASSVQQKWQDREVPFCLFQKDKDQTDLEIALLWAKEHGMTEGVIYGALGGRVDQSMANMTLLADDRFSTCQLAFVHNTTRLCCVRSEIVLHDAIGDTLSLLSSGAEPSRITIRGCQYTLENTPLRYVTHGMSNIITEPSAQVIVHTGRIFVFHLSCSAETNSSAFSP
ncbi:MAG: thiamine diphosphokinase [Holosporales bacterium]|jgi:thiamine pyrophosphokinase|nr:thiamine diphosphokinase [Holosporales bacterium]